MSNTFTGLAIEGMLKLDKHLFAFGQSLPNKQQIKKDIVSIIIIYFSSLISFCLNHH